MAKSGRDNGITSEVLFGGSCACSRITYTSTALPDTCNVCHCITCQKLSGGPYHCYLQVASKSITFYDHKESLRYIGLPQDSIGGISILRLAKMGERAFCLDCHAPLAMRYRHEEGVFHLTLGSVDDKTIKDDRVRRALEPKTHIFTSQAAWWDGSIKDGLPAHARFGGTFEQDMEAWAENN
ncbi:Mss4-like protein [Neohortaea acidophila]|uniref:Mss4-like protein n=1 Tax=Neohortaea acidophila TaxID=245834 RepID=A0A6A6Q080_9PEZI|nr:Mss4-like protein [Neohortaea acidophila]KAF2485682.1 Mss4-like protein [Neohortaea acidophila]